jgi:hypothetical protein
VKVLLAIGGGLVGLVLLYVGGRSVQFAVAERDAALYLPGTANIQIRLNDLEHHLERLEESTAWHVIQKRLLRDPGIRSALNAALKDAELPSLDELEDERHGDQYSRATLLRAVGRDAVGAIQVRESWGRMRAFGCTRLRWSDYLLVPFARLVLPSEMVDDTRVLRLGLGKSDLWIAFEGRLALVSTDREFLAQALRRQGADSPGDHPLTARVEFGSSPALGSIRQRLGDLGVIPQVRWDSVRAIEVVPDLEGPSARLEVSLEGAQATCPDQVPPSALLRLAPQGTTGILQSATGPTDLVEWLRSRVRALGPGDPVGRNIKEALDALDEVGFSTAVLPNLGGGMVVVTGTEEGETDGRLYPALVLLVPSSAPEKAVEALSQLVRARAGHMAEKNFQSFPVGEALLWSFRWPEGAQVNDFFRPCFAALPGVFVFGNNLRFTSAVLQEGAQAGSGGAGSVPDRKLREYGLVPEPALAGGFLLLPALRESLDGPIPKVAEYLVDASLNRPQFRAQLDLELRQEGRRLPEAEIVKLFNDRIAAKERDKQDELRASLHPLDFMKWAAFSLHPGGKGAAFRAAIEFK